MNKNYPHLQYDTLPWQEKPIQSRDAAWINTWEISKSSKSLDTTSGDSSVPRLQGLAKELQGSFATITDLISEQHSPKHNLSLDESVGDVSCRYETESPVLPCKHFPCTRPNLYHHVLEFEDLEEFPKDFQSDLLGSKKEYYQRDRTETDSGQNMSLITSTGSFRTSKSNKTSSLTTASKDIRLRKGTNSAAVSNNVMATFNKAANATADTGTSQNTTPRSSKTTKQAANIPKSEASPRKTESSNQSSAITTSKEGTGSGLAEVSFTSMSGKSATSNKSSEGKSQGNV